MAKRAQKWLTERRIKSNWRQPIRHWWFRSSTALQRGFALQEQTLRAERQ
jgi:hypothetical protein